MLTHGHLMNSYIDIMKLNKLLSLLALLLMVFTLSCAITACGSDDDNPEGDTISIVGKWADGDDIVTFGKDGSYREDSYRADGTLGQYRIGTYSYNPITTLLVLDIMEIPGMNAAYQKTYIVQTLSSTTLVLIYTDGDVKGYYHRQ